MDKEYFKRKLGIKGWVYVYDFSCCRSDYRELKPQVLELLDIYDGLYLVIMPDGDTQYFDHHRAKEASIEVIPNRPDKLVFGLVCFIGWILVSTIMLLISDDFMYMFGLGF